MDRLNQVFATQTPLLQRFALDIKAGDIEIGERRVGARRTLESQARGVLIAFEGEYAIIDKSQGHLLIERCRDHDCLQRLDGIDRAMGRTSVEQQELLRCHGSVAEYQESIRENAGFDQLAETRDTKMVGKIVAFLALAPGLVRIKNPAPLCSRDANDQVKVM